MSVLEPIMDLSKRKFLQQIGAVTAGASLIPIAEAGINFSPTRRRQSRKTIWNVD